ncbi:MAG: hypothetical protein KA004_14655 [Verrucomicrobiales bacterium]|nr:hypothetical protein [Verrucomicrobiales bacterium]
MRFFPNVLWLAAVGLAFAGGAWWQHRNLPVADTTGRAVIASGTTPGAATLPASANHAMPTPAAIESIRDFLLRYQGQGPLGAEKMKEAMREVLTESDPVKSSLMFAMILEELTPENAPAVLGEIKTRMGGFEGFRYMGLLAYKWGAVDGQNAMAEAAKQEGPLKMIGSGATLAGWASKDPAAAMQWVAEQKTENEWEKGAMIRGLVSGLARSDVDAAVNYVSQLKDERERSRMSQVITEEKIKLGVDAAAQWAISLSDPNMKKGAFEGVTEQLYRTDPQKAAEFVKANAGQEFSNVAAGELARRLAEKNPQQGLGFAAELPEGPGRSDAYRNAFREWAVQDPEAASRQLNDLPKGGDRDAAASGLARSVARDDPEGATAWAESISDAAMRQESLTSVLRTRYRRDPDAALSYMTAKGWTEAQQNEVKIEKEEDGGFRPFGPRGRR